ncbi:hypothetical protein FQA39_LY19248 [Lamprigera yunnana]|nr:hypothetical protein FQA39_LY19248 [Lamprigera yunnana]
MWQRHARRHLAQGVCGPARPGAGAYAKLQRPAVAAQFLGEHLVARLVWDELPHAQPLQAQRAKGWVVLGLAVDKESAVVPFLQRMPLAFPIAIAGMEGTALSRDLGNSVGALPFTVVFDSRGAVQHPVGAAMDLRKLKTLIDLVSESNVSELEITEAEGKVRIVKGGGAVAQQAWQQAWCLRRAAPRCPPALAAKGPAAAAH